jgi:hypothetical protein
MYRIHRILTGVQSRTGDFCNNSFSQGNIETENLGEKEANYYLESIPTISPKKP